VRRNLGKCLSASEVMYLEAAYISCSSADIWHCYQTISFNPSPGFHWKQPRPKKLIDGPRTLVIDHYFPTPPHSIMETIAHRLLENDDADDTDVVRPPPRPAAALAHYIKTTSLVIASIALLPLSSYVLAFSYACNILIPQYELRRKIQSVPRFQPKTILVTGVGTAKGLRIARAFYETGHKVIGADFQPLGIPSCGRFSKALSTYYPLRMPTASGGATLYMRDLIKIVEGEAVQLWVSCSELVCAVDDGQTRELLEHRTSCRTVQVDVDTVGKISDNNEFLRYARSIGLVYCMTLPS
jgi:hypothetical protein